MRLLDFDPGEAIAEKILTLAAMHGFGNDLQRREMHALAVAMDRRQAQHVMGVRHRRRVAARRGLPDIVDHASASHSKSDRSLLVRYAAPIASDNFISACSTSMINAASIAAASAVRKRVAVEAAIC